MSDTSTATLLYPTAACALLKFGTVERERDKVEHSGRYVHNCAPPVVYTGNPKSRALARCAHEGPPSLLNYTWAIKSRAAHPEGNLLLVVMLVVARARRAAMQRARRDRMAATAQVHSWRRNNSCSIKI